MGRYLGLGPYKSFWSTNLEKKKRRLEIPAPERKKLGEIFRDCN